MPLHERPVGRRAVLRAGAVVIASVAVPGCALFLTLREPDVTVAAEGGAVRIPLSAAPWLHGGEGTLAVAVTGRDGKILLFRDPSGALAAVDMTCTHRGCDVAWDGVRKRLACPCHGSEFAPAGDLLEGPATRPLRAHAVSVVGEEAVVALA